MSKISPSQKLKQLGISLPPVPAPAGSYVPCVRTGNLVFVSGQLPFNNGKLLFRGTVGVEVSVEQAKLAAREAAVNCLAVLNAQPGGLDAVRRIVKVTGYVASSDRFVRQADVVNGASDFFAEVFGSAGRHSRAAVGAVSLPLGSPVEIEIVAEAEPA